MITANKIILNRGDTVPNTFKSSALIPKMDLRIVSSPATTTLRLFRWRICKKGHEVQIIYR
jgi:hypothetical protein